MLYVSNLMEIIWRIFVSANCSKWKAKILWLVSVCVQINVIWFGKEELQPLKLRNWGPKAKHHKNNILWSLYMHLVYQCPLMGNTSNTECELEIRKPLSSREDAETLNHFFFLCVWSCFCSLLIREMQSNHFVPVMFLSNDPKAPRKLW